MKIKDFRFGRLFLCLGHLSVVSRLSVGGGMGGDVTTVGVVLIRDSRAHNPHYIILGAKVQKIFDICKIFVYYKNN